MRVTLYSVLWTGVVGCATSASGVQATARDASAEAPTDVEEVCPSVAGAPLRATPSGPDAVVQYVESTGPTCILRGDGHIRCIGPTALGIFGDVHSHVGTEQSPVTIPGLDDAIDFATVHSQGCAVRRDGSVWCWGDNADGLIHPDLPRENLVPTPIPGITHARRVLMNETSVRTCALVDDRAVCFGGSAGSASSVHGLDGIEALTTNRIQSCALRLDGTVWCDPACAWTRERGVECAPANPPSVWGDIATVAEISAGALVTCARTIAGEVQCRPHRQIVVHDPALGERSFREWTTRCATSLGLSSQRACVAQTDGHVVCGGLNADQSLERELFVERTVPGLDRVRKVFQTLLRSCALRDDGTLWCWGGADPTRSSWQPVQVRW